LPSLLKRFQARTLVVAAVLCAAAMIYTARLNSVPSFLSTDETAFALQAHSIATTLHDVRGRFLPLYFQMFQNVWFHPALVYSMAPVLAVTRPFPWAVRLPTVIVALCNILLVYVLARRLGTSTVAAIGASVLLALTPGHLMHGRLACDYLFPVPFVLAWLVLLVDASNSQSPWRFFAAGSVLGLGLYTYIASLVTMPVCLGLTYLGLFASGARRVRPYALVTAGFVAAVLPLAIYLVASPEIYASFVSRYGGTSVDLDVLHHPGAVFSAHFAADRWPIYRSFFEPSFLFEKAVTHVMSSTYTTGVFLEATKFLIPIGLYHIIRNRRTPFTLLLLATFLAAPLAASTIPEKYAIDRALVLVPTAALIAAFGVDWLLVPRPWFATWPARAACLGLFVWMAWQFNGFYREYLTTYPVRASFWFDGNHPGAFEPLISQHPPDDPRLIYLSTTLPRINDHWTLYLIRRGRKDLLKRTVLFSQEDLRLGAVRPGSLLLTGADDAAERSFLKMPAVAVVDKITEPDGAPSFTIFQRTTWSGLFLYDGTYSVKMDVDCTPGGSGQACRSAVTTVACPSMDMVTVANNLVIDSCGYLNQTAIDDNGRYSGMSNYGIPVSGAFTTSGLVRLSGSGVSESNRYDLTFTLTRRD
jgi:4-amino-4-deoxy-L-arabinose transferase-like glycosyltransferase